MAIDRSRLLADAEKAARRGNMKQAADCYRALVEASPNDRTLLQRLGDALARAGESQAACEVLEDLAELYRAEGDQHRSVAVLRRACRLAEDRELLDKLGCWLCEQGLAADARQPLLEAARLHEAAGDPAAALAVWRRLAEGREGDLEALREVLRLGAADGAQALSVRERAALAVDLSRHSALEESIENFVAAAAAGPALIEGGWLEHFMRAFERLGHLPERAETINEPGVAANWVLLRAGILERLGRRDEARAELVDGLRSAAAWPVSARLAAGRMLIGLEVFDAAAKVLLGLGPSPPGISTHALKDALSELVTRDPGQHAVMERLLAISSAAEPSTGEEGAKRSTPGDGTPTAAAPGADESEPGEQQPALSTTLRAEVLEIESFVAHGMYSRARAALASLAGRAGPHPEVLRLEQAVEALRPAPPPAAKAEAPVEAPPPLAMGDGAEPEAADDEEWVIDFDEDTADTDAPLRTATPPVTPASGAATPLPGAFDGLEECLQQALPEEDLETRYQMAVGLWEMDLSEQALAIFEAIARQGGCRAVESALMVVRAWSEQGRLEQALEVVEAVVEGEGPEGDVPEGVAAELWARGALLAHALGKSEQAVGWLERMERRFPGSAMLGTVRERLGASKL